MPFISAINITIEFMFAGINMFWARLRLILGPKKGPKHIYAREHKLYCYINITLEGIEKIKTEKNDNRTV